MLISNSFNELSRKGFHATENVLIEPVVVLIDWLFQVKGQGRMGLIGKQAELSSTNTNLLIGLNSNYYYLTPTPYLRVLGE